MRHLEDIRGNRELLDAIDWEMTPEEAVTLYLEWGNNWSHGKMVRSRNDVSHYFVLSTWQDPPVVSLIQRNSEAATEIAEIELPPGLRERIWASPTYRKGIYGLPPEVKDWLMDSLAGN